MTESSKKLMEDKEYMGKINFLIVNNLPIPVSHCNNCRNTIYKLGYWYECPNCGTVADHYTGIQTVESGKSSREWVDKCNQSKAYLSNK